METIYKLQAKEKGTGYWFDIGTFKDLDSMFDEYQRQLYEDLQNGEADDYEYREVRITNFPKIQAL